MPTNDFISNILEIKDLNLLNVESSNTELHIHFKLKHRDHVCPKCGAITNKVHDYRTSTIKDAPILGKHLFLHYSKWRYRCTSCNARFLERFTLLPKTLIFFAGLTNIKFPNPSFFPQILSINEFKGNAAITTYVIAAL